MTSLCLPESENIVIYLPLITLRSITGIGVWTTWQSNARFSDDVYGSFAGLPIRFSYVCVALHNELPLKKMVFPHTESHSPETDHQKVWERAAKPVGSLQLTIALCEHLRRINLFFGHLRNIIICRLRRYLISFFALTLFPLRKNCKSAPGFERSDQHSTVTSWPNEALVVETLIRGLPFSGCTERMQIVEDKRCFGSEKSLKYYPSTNLARTLQSNPTVKRFNTNDSDWDSNLKQFEENRWSFLHKLVRISILWKLLVSSFH